MTKKMICINSYTDSWTEADYFDEECTEPTFEYECGECGATFTDSWNVPRGDYTDVPLCFDCRSEWPD